MKNQFKKIIESNKFSYIIQTLIIFSVLSFSIETLPHVNPKLKLFLSYTETIIVILFTLEYIIRIYTSNLKYVFSFFGLIDLLAILPFYITLGSIDIRALRIFRLFRIFRLLKLLKFTSSIKKF